MIMTLFKEEAPANFVPAAAVIRRRQVLSRMIGRKASVDGFCCFKLKIGFVLIKLKKHKNLEFDRR